MRPIVLALCVMLTACTSRPAAVTDEEWAYCTDDGHPAGGTGTVLSFAQVYVPGLPPPSDSVRDTAKSDPQFGAACRVAFELTGLTREQWDWCFRDENRAEFLAPAVELLGMGEEEVLGTESFGEAPGDDPAEYTQACRLAFGNWREDGIDETDATSDPFFRLTDAQTEWCDDAANQWTLEWAAESLGIETPEEAPEIHQFHAYARACRLAFLLGEIPQHEPVTHVVDRADLFGEAEQADAERRLADVLEETEPPICVVIGTGDGFAVENPLARSRLHRCQLEFVMSAFEDPLNHGCCGASYSGELDGLYEAARPAMQLFNSGEFSAGLALWLDIVEEETASFTGPEPRRIP